jgi:type I restriction enzyme S subunit
MKFSDLKRMPIAIPPASEQTAIATFLDHETAKIDALIAEQEKLIALLAEKRQATISHAVTHGLNPDAPMKDSGVAWLGEVPAHWNTSRLSHLSTQIVDGAHFTPTYIDDGVPFLRVTDITGGSPDLDDVKRIPEVEHRELCRRCQPKKGDLLLSKNGTIGVPKVVTWDWDFSIFVSLCLIKMRPEMLAKFAAYVFESSTIKIQIDEGAKQSTVTNLHLEKIAAFRFPVPPIDEQEDIVARLNVATAGFDALIIEAECVITLIKERRSALIAAAVTGQIDVRGWAAPPQVAEAT